MTAPFLISLVLFALGLAGSFAQNATVTSTTNANGSLTLLVSGPAKPKTLTLSWDASPSTNWHNGYVVGVTGQNRAEKIYRGHQRSLVVSNIVAGTYVFTVRTLDHNLAESLPVTASYTVPVGPSFRLNITTETLQ